MTSAEFAEWIAFDRVYPFTIDRAEYAMAINSSVLASAHSKDKAFSYADFLLEPRRRQQDPRAMEKILEAMYGTH